ncbi:MAG TPA: putative glycolipid-binding domain-containing protein [Actinoplanes sp.]
MVGPTSYDTATRPGSVGLLTAEPGDDRPGPLAWQRTDTVGTELVLHHAGVERLTAAGSAVVAGALPHTIGWAAELEPSWAVRALTVTCQGDGWSRTVRLRHDGPDGWTCRTEETGDLDEAPAGTDDPGRLDGAALVHLSDSPIFLTWALRRLALTPDSGPVCAPTIRVRTPSLTVLPGTSTYHLLSGRRLRISGAEPSTRYDLDDAGIVTYQPGRFRLVH